METTRIAYSVSYVADGAVLLPRQGNVRTPDDEDMQSYADWVEEVGYGNVADHDSIPIVFYNDDEEG